MTDAQLRRIKSVNVRPGYRLVVALERGPVVTVDLSDMISRGGVFKDLADKDIFDQVRIGENNRVVEWPIPKDDLGYPTVEIDADALFEKHLEQQNGHMASAMRKLFDTFQNLKKVSAKPIKS